MNPLRHLTERVRRHPENKKLAKVLARAHLLFCPPPTYSPETRARVKGWGNILYVPLWSKDYTHYRCIYLTEQDGVLVGANAVAVGRHRLNMIDAAAPEYHPLPQKYWDTKQVKVVDATCGYEAEQDGETGEWRVWKPGKEEGSNVDTDGQVYLIPPDMTCTCKYFRSGHPWSVKHRETGEVVFEGDVPGEGPSYLQCRKEPDHPLNDLDYTNLVVVEGSPHGDFCKHTVARSLMEGGL